MTNNIDIKSYINEENINIKNGNAIENNNIKEYKGSIINNNEITNNTNANNSFTDNNNYVNSFNDTNANNSFTYNNNYDNSFYDNNNYYNSFYDNNNYYYFNEERKNSRTNIIKSIKMCITTFAINLIVTIILYYCAYFFAMKYPMFLKFLMLLNRLWYDFVINFVMNTYDIASFVFFILQVTSEIFVEILVEIIIPDITSMFKYCMLTVLDFLTMLLEKIMYKLYELIDTYLPEKEIIVSIESPESTGTTKTTEEEPNQYLLLKTKIYMLIRLILIKTVELLRLVILLKLYTLRYIVYYILFMLNILPMIIIILFNIISFIMDTLAEYIAMFYFYSISEISYILGKIIPDYIFVHIFIMVDCILYAYKKIKKLTDIIADRINSARRRRGMDKAYYNTSMYAIILLVLLLILFFLFAFYYFDYFCKITVFLILYFMCFLISLLQKK